MKQELSVKLSKSDWEIVMDALDTQGQKDYTVSNVLYDIKSQLSETVECCCDCRECERYVCCDYGRYIYDEDED